MIIRLLLTYIYLIMEAQNMQPFSLKCTKEKLLILNDFALIGYKKGKSGKIKLFLSLLFTPLKVCIFQLDEGIVFNNKKAD